MNRPRGSAPAGGTDDIPAELRGTGVRGRFAAETERLYRTWLIEQVRPVAVVLGVLAVAAWAIIPVFFAVTDDRSRRHAVLFGLGWGVVLPVMLGALVYVRRPASRAVIPVVATALFVVGSMNVVITALCLPDTDAGAYTTSMAFYTLLAPAVRLPVRATLAVAVPLTAVGEVAAMLGAAGPWDRVFIGPNGTLPSVTLLIAPGVALISERGLRARFAGEQLIERQRQQLAVSSRLIRKYAPSAVASRLERGDTTIDQPQRRRVTVFSSDLVGFTTLADQVDPEALAEIVNGYVSALAEIIERHGGTVNEFAGDGMMAIFGAPDELPPAAQVRAAVAAARELQASLPKWSRDWYQHGIATDLKARVGINTGMASVGTFGSAVRATYTGIGLQTNIAARIQSHATPGKVLLSSTSWHLVKDTIACTPRGEIDVKGVHFSLAVYELADP